MLHCYYCDRTEEDGVTLITALCNTTVCEDCFYAHRGCPACATELSFQRADYEFDKRRTE